MTANLSYQLQRVLTCTILTCLLGLAGGLAVVVVDIDEYGWGLYVILLSLVVLTLSTIFWVVGPADDETKTERALGQTIQLTVRPLVNNDRVTQMLDEACESSMSLSPTPSTSPHHVAYPNIVNIERSMSTTLHMSAIGIAKNPKILLDDRPKSSLPLPTKIV